MDAIIFDFGNVIGFFEHRRGIEKLADHVEIDVEEVHRALHDPEIAIPYECGTITTSEFFAGLRQRAGFECDDETMRECLSDIFWPNEEIPGVINQLLKNYKVYLLSNTCEMHADRFVVDYDDTLGSFESLFLSHHVGFIKPDSAIYYHVQNEIGADPESIVFIDDREENVETAKSVGWQGIQFRSVPELQDALQHLGVE